MKHFSQKLRSLTHLETKRKNFGLTDDEEKRYRKLSSEITGYKEEVFTKEFSDKLTDII